MNLDLEALRLELEIAAAARQLYGCMCNLDQEDPESTKACVRIGLAIDAANEHEFPEPLKCTLENPTDATS